MGAIIYDSNNEKFSFNFGGAITHPKETKWEKLLWSANSDFINVLILWYSGVIIGSTYAWMFPHTIEKYIKSYLLKYKIKTMAEIKKYKESGHETIGIWNDFKKFSNLKTTKNQLNENFEKFIEDISTIKTNIRYDGMLSYSSCSFIYYYIVLCSLLRYDIIGKTNYRSDFYGLGKLNFGAMNYVPMSEGYGFLIVRKMLHLSLEHAYSFTNLGTINAFDFENLSISNTAMSEQDPECPLCNGNNNQIELIKFYRDIKPSVLK